MAEEIILRFEPGTLKLSTKDYVVYKKDYLRSHFALEYEIMCGFPMSNYDIELSMPDEAIKKAISDYDEMVCYANSKFKLEEFSEEYNLGYGLYDLIAKYGGLVVLEHWKKWKGKNG